MCDDAGIIIYYLFIIFTKREESIASYAVKFKSASTSRIFYSFVPVLRTKITPAE